MPVFTTVTPGTPQLNPRQARMLWLLSQGLLAPEIAREVGTTATGVRTSTANLYKRLGVRNAAQAVAYALINGIIGPYEDCGSLAAYRRHHDRDESTCQACRLGNAYRLDNPEVSAGPVTLTTPQLRLLRAFDAGRSHTQIADAWGVSRPTVERLTTSLYRAFGAQDLPRQLRRPAVLEQARTLKLLSRTPPAVAPPRPFGRVRPLTSMERTVLTVMADGRTITQGAALMGIPRSTLATRLSYAYRRLDVLHLPRAHRRREAVRIAREHGFIPGEPLA